MVISFGSYQIIMTVILVVRISSSLISYGNSKDWAVLVGRLLADMAFVWLLVGGGFYSR